MIASGQRRAYSRGFHLDCTPYDLAAAFHRHDYFVFLDSSDSDGEQGRYSILGWEPQLVFRSKNTTVELRRDGEWQTIEDNPIHVLQGLMQEWRPAASSSESEPRFAGGAMGYLGYDLLRFFEDYADLKAVDDLKLPDCCLGFYDTIFVFDHRSRQWTIAGASTLPAVELDADIESRLNAIQNHSYRGIPLPLGEGCRRPGEDVPPHSNMTRADYLERVRRALAYIDAGDIYQVNLSQRFSCVLDASPFDLFSSLRAVSPSFYGAYLNCGNHTLISSSPELFLLREGERIETRPIKGTRPRGSTPQEDELLERELVESGKEAAELAMIVDLERNDLGRICRFGSVEVPHHRYVERLPTVFHTVSTVSGVLREDLGIIDILRAAFPGGSISGCPKIRAIEIIDELEPAARHVYTGAIGFIGRNGDLRLNIAIRTMTVTGNRVYYQVGSGIVADSIPEQEYEETLHKAAAMQAAMDSLMKN